MMIKLTPHMSETRINNELGNVGPNDVVEFGAGTYYHPLRFSSGGGQAETAVKVYFENAIIDGDYKFPNGAADGRLYHPDAEPVHHVPLVAVEASHIELNGAEVRHSAGRGIRAGIGGERLAGIAINDVLVHACRHRGVGFQYVDNGQLTNSVVYHCGNFAQFPRSADNDPEDHKGVNWPTIVTTFNSKNIIIQGNEIYESWGELIAAGLNCQGIQILDNVVYDGFLGIYANRCQETKIIGNFAYHTRNPNFLRGSRKGSPGNGIEAQNEQHRDGAVAKNIVIQDNIVVGWGRGLVSGGGQGTGEMPTDLFYTSNTVVECTRHDGKGAGIQLLPPKTTTQVTSNLIQQSDNRTIVGGTGDGYTIQDNMENQTSLPTVSDLLATGRPITRLAFASPEEAYGAHIEIPAPPATPIPPVPKPVASFFDTAYAQSLSETDLAVARLLEIYGDEGHQHMPGHEIAMFGYRLMQHIKDSGVAEA